jgi:hypothetical protein
MVCLIFRKQNFWCQITHLKSWDYQKWSKTHPILLIIGRNWTYNLTRWRPFSLLCHHRFLGWKDAGTHHSFLINFFLQLFLAKDYPNGREEQMAKSNMGPIRAMKRPICEYPFHRDQHFWVYNLKFFLTLTPRKYIVPCVADIRKHLLFSRKEEEMRRYITV